MACMESDKDNVFVVLTARRLAPAVRIVASTERIETEAKLTSVGANAVVSPSRIGGLRIASELVRPQVVSFLDQMLRDKRSSLRVEEVTVLEEARMASRTVGGLKVNEIDGAVLLAVRHPETGAFEFKPSPETPLEPGMTLVVMADAEGISRLEKRLRVSRGFQQLEV